MRFLHTYPPDSHPTVEMVYPLASHEGHQIIRTAVVAALKRLRPLSPVPTTAMQEGVTGYYLAFGNLFVQILVVQLTDLLANVQVTITGKLTDSDKFEEADETLQTPLIMDQIAIVLGAIERYAQDFLRKAYLLDELKPPPPPLDDHQALFYYQRIYFPHLDDNQFSEHVGVPVPTLRNWRHAAGMTQGSFRPVPLDWGLIRPGMSDDEFAQFKNKHKERRRKR